MHNGSYITERESTCSQSETSGKSERGELGTAYDVRMNRLMRCASMGGGVAVLPRRPYLRGRGAIGE